MKQQITPPTPLTFTEKAEAVCQTCEHVPSAWKRCRPLCPRIPPRPDRVLAGLATGPT